MGRQFSDSHDEGELQKSSQNSDLIYNSILIAPGIAGLAGIAFIPLALAFRRPASLSLRVAAYACPVSVVHAMALDYADRKNVSRASRPAGGELISNGTRVLCAAAGLLLATRCRLHGLKGWQRTVGAASMGAGVGELAQLSFNNLHHSSEARDFWDQFIELKNDHATSARVLVKFEWRSVLDTLSQRMPSGPSTAASEEHKFRTDAMARMPAEGDAPFLHSGNVKVITINQDGPHSTVKGPQDTEPITQPIPNYYWTPSADRVIPELDEHISNLRARRKKLCAEAQVVWDWLMQKEAQFYQLRDSSTAVGYDAEQSKLHAHAYCRVLADKHVWLWMEVSKIDWIIADSLKRIDQHKDFRKGRYDVPKKSHSSAEPSPLYYTRSRAHRELSETESKIEQYTKGIEQVERERKDPRMSSLPKELLAQVQAMSKHDQEMFYRKLTKHGEDMKQQVMLVKTALEELLKDAEKKSPRPTRED